MTLGVLVALTVHAETFKVFGSAGAETQLTPANPASPLLRGNTSAVAYQTNSADAVAFIRAGNLHLKLRADSDGSASLSEAFVQFAPRPWLTVAAGRIIEKWGTGYAWNPVAFISPRKNPADPSDRRSSYTGLDMVRADAFVRDTNISLYALEGGQYAARVYRLVRGTDISLHLTNHQHGLSVARVFGDALEPPVATCSPADSTRFATTSTSSSRSTTAATGCRPLPGARSASASTRRATPTPSSPPIATMSRCAWRATTRLRASIAPASSKPS
jgi:hypothetical protein